MKMATKILSGICVLILCFVALGTNISCQQFPASLGEAITITYGFPAPLVEKAWEIPRAKGALPGTQGYVSVTMERLPQWSEPGLPVLPFKTAEILLPYGFDVGHITVTCGNKVALPGSYVVEPGQKAVPLSYEGPVEPTPPNLEVYDSSALFPGKLYSGDTVQNKAGYRILLMNLHPVEYIPKRGQLSYYESLTLKVTLRPADEGEWQDVSHLAQDEDMVREIVDNPEAMKSYRAALSSFEVSSLLALADYEYVIITSEALNATPGPNNFQGLRDEKISRNITATIVTTEWIYANYSGTRPDGGEDNQTRIRNFIIDAYNTWGTRYVLLGGDGDGDDVGGESGDAVIPHRGFAVLDLGAYSDSDIPADMYYACLDGTFDYNANGVYGEPDDGPGGGEVDLFAEVYVGRAAVDSEAEVQSFVSKTLAYQGMASTDQNLRKVWMVGEYLGFGGVGDWGGNYKDEIRQGSSAHGYTTIGFEDSAYNASFDVSTLYDRDYPGNNWPKSEIIDVINGNTHLINHLGHANVGYVMKMYNSDVDGLTNSELYFIGYSQGCYCGSFDNRTDVPDYTSYDCISEHLTTEPHGAVAFIANSRYGWGSGDSTDGPSQHYDREFWDAVLGEDILNIGIANQDSKEDNAGRVGDPCDRWCYYQINLFGDPELTLKLPEVVIYESHEIADSAGGDGDGYPEPGESITMPVTLRNASTNITFSDVSATLSAIWFNEEALFSDDIEAGQDGWTCDGLWHLTEHRSYSATHSWYYGIEDVWNYDTGGNNSGSLVSPPIDLTGLSGATLTFWYWYETESEGSMYDQRWVLISVDGGFPEPLEQLFGDDMNTWQQHTTDLSSYVGHSVQIIFSFDTIDDIGNDYEGWYIDDVIVTGFVPDTDPYISISDDYEEYGNIPPDDIATSLDAYDFTIAPACPAGHVVTFTLNITASNGGPWTDSFARVIVAPPEVSSVSVTQRSDGSGIVDVSYDALDNGQSTVDVALEYWDPSGSWRSCTNTAGDVGPGVNIGTGKATTWDAKAQLGEVYISGCKVRVTADDGASGTGSAESNIFDLDTAPPKITGKSPIGSDASVDSSITIAFSEPMNTSSAESAFSISPTVPGSFSWTDNTMTFDPTTNLAYSTEYTVTIHGTAMDSAGNGLDGNENGIAEGSPADDYTWSFTTKAAVVGGGCFIATAAYGTPVADEIQILREFRDSYLLTNPMGQALVDFYYKVSPSIAEFIIEHPSLKPIVRAGLVPAVAMSTVAVNTSLAEKIAIVGLSVLVSVALAVWATRRRGRGVDCT